MESVQQMVVIKIILANAKKIIILPVKLCLIMKNVTYNDLKRKLIRLRTALQLLGISLLVSGPMDAQGQDNDQRLKISINAFSFNEPLSNGSMTIEDLLEFCAEKNILAVDITAYYFPGYPNVPADDYLYDINP